MSLQSNVECAFLQVAIIEEQAGGRKGLFTLKALWEAIPLDLYCQTVGTSHSDPKFQQAMLDAVPLGMAFLQ